MDNNAAAKERAWKAELRPHLTLSHKVSTFPLPIEVFHTFLSRGVFFLPQWILGAPNIY